MPDMLNMHNARCVLQERTRTFARIFWTADDVSKRPAVMLLDSDWLRAVQFKYNTSANYTSLFWIMIVRKTMGKFGGQ